jgi:hypothetical protein
MIITTIIISALYLYYKFYFLPTAFSKLSEILFMFWIPYVFVGIGLNREDFIKIPKYFILSIFLVPLECYILRNYSLTHSGYITPMVCISSIFFCVCLMQIKLEITNKFLRIIIDFFGQSSIFFI